MLKSIKSIKKYRYRYRYISLNCVYIISDMKYVEYIKIAWCS